MRFRRTGKLAVIGIRGRAEVLQITHTGMQANNLAKIRVRVRIAAEGLAAFEYENDWTVPVIALRSLHPGNLLPVYVDPADPERFEIQWLARPERAQAPETEDQHPDQDRAEAAGSAGEPASASEPAEPASEPAPPEPASAMSPSNPQAGSPAQWGYAQPESARPESARPESARPESARPESARPESARPESARPESAQPESAQPGESRPGEAQPVNGYLDPWARLTKLHALRNEGAITEADFQEHKRRILSDL